MYKLILEIEDHEDCPGAIEEIKSDLERFKASTIDLFNTELPEIIVTDVRIECLES